MERRLLVMGAGTGASNNLIRSLRAGNPPFFIVGCHHDPFYLKKSASDENYLISRSDQRGFVESLQSVIAAERIDLLIPNSDSEVRSIGTLRDEIGCRVFLPSSAVVALCQDKYELGAFLAARGIATPRTYAVTSLDGIEEIFGKFPPRSRLWCRIRTGAGSAGAIPVTTPEQARSWISYWDQVRGVPVVAFTLSEYLPGRDFACQSLWKDGKVVLIKTTERVSYFGTSNAPSGTSSVASIHKTVCEPRVVEVSAEAVSALGRDVSGAFSVDLKERPDGTPCVTEINAGRFLSGTTVFDTTGLHNMAVTYVRLALGEPLEIADPYDATDGHYMVRDLDTLPDVFVADELFDGIKDARGGR
jgi:carbamoyl-phosphate synthase large subunit